MSTDLSALLERARQSAAAVALDGAQQPGQPSQVAKGSSEPPDADRQKLVRVAQEFESMLLVQVLKDMRAAGKWDDEEDSNDQSGFGALFEMADTELAGHLARAQGFGLSKQLLEAFDRMGVDGQSPSTTASPEIPSAIPPALPPSPPSLPAPVPSPAARSTVPDAAAETADSVTVPTVDGRVTSQFGWRRDPFTGQSKFHRGVDLAAVYGQDVQAARAGRVVFSGGQGGYGNTVVVEHSDGTRSRYAHLSATLVAQGDTVDAGQAVGRAGHSGRATGTHVHFEVTSADGRPVAPDGWLKKT